MSEEVTVPFDDHTTDNAVLLLAAAEDLNLDPSVVRTAEGAFVVPKEVHEKAFPPAKKATKRSAPQKTQE